MSQCGPAIQLQLGCYPAAMLPQIEGSAHTRRGAHRKQAKLQKEKAVYGALLLAGFVFRFIIAQTTWRQPDSDEATGMIMALQAARGHLSLVFWGGNYGGAVMSWIEAPLVLIFGLNLWMFWVIDTAVTLVGVLIFGALCRRLLPPVAAAAAAGSFWFFPALWIFWSSREYAFWLPAIVFALASCLLLLRWIERHQHSDLLGFGLCAGLAIWSYPLTAPLLIPPLGIFIMAERHRLANVLRAAAAAVLGVSPWLAFFVVHGRKAFTLQQTTGGLYAPLRHSVTQVLPTALFGGQKRSDVIWATPMLSPHRAEAVGMVIMAISLLVALVSMFTRRIGILACALSVILWPVLLVLGHVPIAVATFRYGFIVLPPILVIAGYLVSLVRASVLFGGLTLLSSTWITFSDTGHLSAAPSCNVSVTSVDRWLVAHDRTAVWASYWLAGPMEVCDYRYLTVSAVAPIRDHAAEIAALKAPVSTYVVFSGNQLDAELLAWMHANPGTAQRMLVAGYAVYTFDRATEPAQMRLVGAF